LDILLIFIFIVCLIYKPMAAKSFNILAGRGTTLGSKPKGNGFRHRPTGFIRLPSESLENVTNLPAEIDLNRDLTLRQKITNVGKRELMAITLAYEKTLPTLQIKAIKLHMMSHETLEKIAVCECTIPSDKGAGSPNDPRMCTLENNELCSSCKKTNIDCPGHLGIIRLRHWFPHSLLTDKLINVLDSVCSSCSEVIVSESYFQQQGILNLRGEARLKKIAELTRSNKTRCKHNIDPDTKQNRCHINPKYEIRDGYKIMAKYDINKGKEENGVPIVKIFDILQRITAKGALLLGFENGEHPKNLIVRSIPVIPECARPYVYQDGVAHNDFITTQYIDIIRYNNILANPDRSTANAEIYYQNNVRGLHFAISHLLDNTDKRYTKAPQGGAPIPGIKERISRKNGIVRMNLMAKRVNFSERSVSGTYHTLRFNQIGVPEIVKRTFTRPVTVNFRNKQHIQDLYTKGDVIFITLAEGDTSGRKYRVIDAVKKSYPILRIGDICEMIGKDGDPVFYNRQPTLHKQSFMGYIAKYTNKKTNDMQMSNTTPHNQDFDGDEGNLHAPQTLAAQVECKLIASNENCIMDGQTNKPMMGIVFNGLVSAYLMSQPDVILDEEDYQTCLSLITNRDDLPTLETRLKKWRVPPRSGYAIISALLPATFHYDKRSLKNDVVNHIYIRDGIYINVGDGVTTTCVLTSEHLGRSHNSIIQYLWKWHGGVRTSDFFTDAQYIFDWYIAQVVGFTVSLKDMGDEDQKDIQQKINIEVEQIQMKIDSLGDETSNMTPLEKEQRENRIKGYCNTSSKIGKDISMKNLSQMNPLKVMPECGAKGNDVNTAQILGLVGQQFIKGERPEMTMAHGTRTLPYCEPNSRDIKTRGFCRNSFYTGLDPIEEWFHLEATRIGLTDSAIKTAVTGHLHHLMIKVLEDILHAQDGTSRNAENRIFQFNYDDGFNPAELQHTNSAIVGDCISFIDVKNSIERAHAEVGIYKSPGTNEYMSFENNSN
jgi:DNA-directed RNA polymerase II subunit RPB1